MSDEAPTHTDSTATGVEDSRSADALREALGSDFTIKRELGRGTMASVFLATEKALGRSVAVKVLHPGRARDETSRRRFEREARSAAKLAHPNVVEVFRFGRLADESPYLVMRFVKGRTLEERLKAEGRLDAAQARTVLANVASGLAAAHAQGIVHRDVRPANVLWDEERDVAVLADFGIAAVLETSGEEVTRLTQTGQLIGDPRYLSPEQLLDQDLTELADMYAFGVMGYELLTEHGPYDAKTNTQWITAHLKADPIDLLTVRPDVDPGLASLLRRCLAREPKHRPSAADAARLLSAEGDMAVEVSDDVDRGVLGLLADLGKKRIPQYLVAGGGSAIGFLAGVQIFVEMDNLPEIVWDLAIPAVVCGFLAGLVVTWFHGEKGPQRTGLVERVLLALIVVLWVGLSARVLLAG